jgi:hypothetical protein
MTASIRLVVSGTAVLQSQKCTAQRAKPAIAIRSGARRDDETTEKSDTHRMREVNRSAVIVTAKQPFLNWVRSMDTSDLTLTLDDMNEEPVIYLVPECESDEEFAAWIDNEFELIFQEQLAGWWTDVSTWPTGRFRCFTTGLIAGCTHWCWMSCMDGCRTLTDSVFLRLSPSNVTDW